MYEKRRNIIETLFGETGNMVSIILCTYNRAYILKETIDSILAQTYEDFELIIVDDGSTDDTQELLAEYSDARIRSFVLQKNSFYCAAANYGLTKARGNYIAFATSDDLWERKKLELQMRYMEKRKECGACFTFVHIIDEKGENVDKKYLDMLSVLRKNFFTQRDWIQRFLFEGNCLCHPSALVRKEVMDQVGGYHLYYSLLADMELWLRIVRYYPIHVIEEDLVGYRVFSEEGNQLSGVATEEKVTKSLNEHMLIRKNFINDLTDEELIQFFENLFRFKEAFTHQELEIERAFLLMNCVNDLPELNVLGMEKFEELLRDPEYVSVLKNTYHLNLQDIYKWNIRHFYMDYTIHTLFGEKDQEIVRGMKDIRLLKERIEQIEKENEKLRNDMEDVRKELANKEIEKKKLGIELEAVNKELSEEKQKYTLKEKECKELMEVDRKKTDLLNRALLEKLRIQEKQ